MKKDNIFENLFEMAYEPYIVTKKASSSQKNTFPTIFAALNHVEEHSLIKINPGLYEERFNIKYILPHSANATSRSKPARSLRTPS